MTSDSNVVAAQLPQEIYDELYRFLSTAAAQGVRSLVIDCVAKTVTVDYLTAQDNGNDDSTPNNYLLTLISKKREGAWADIVYGTWKSRQYLDVSLQLAQSLIKEHLEDLLLSNFLIVDEGFLKTNMALYNKELEELGLAGKGYEERYCLLRNMVNLKAGRYILNEDIACKYYNRKGDQLPKDSLTKFVNFIVITSYIYEKFDGMAAPPDKLSDADTALLLRILNYTERVDWQKPATCDSAKLFIRTLFGDDTRYLKDTDREKTRTFRDFFKTGRAGQKTDRVDISMANIIGHLIQLQLIGGGLQDISKTVFGSIGQLNNINKGIRNEANRAFSEIVSFMDDYLHIIRCQTTS